ncbi:BCCT family transporter [Paraferrimonas haliotis]|uniref:Glycine betaine transporter n=1 Tax=Paraferrimonas haliotis TaxID=2013866 RepID=A0AA37WYG2_9GAMM|nr:hypothetical protein GCM10007894_10230 [Paraferrimonas haliotis]
MRPSFLTSAHADNSLLPRLVRFIVLAGFMALLISYPEYSILLMSQAIQWALDTFGLALLCLSSGIIIVCSAIAVSPLGRIKLGGEGAQPEFGLFSWLAMLFAAGMGSGLIFWGVAEPISHFANPPAFVADSQDLKDTALALTYFHWGLHAWAIYALAGLAVAWFGFNRGRELRISASFSGKPRPGAWVILDWLAIIAILFGVAGTFANTIALVQTGVEQSTSITFEDSAFRYGLLVLIGLLFMASSLTGLNRGIKYVSQFNLILMITLALVVLMLSGSLNSLWIALTSSVEYLKLLPQVSFSIAPESKQWSIGWTVIYLVWWVAWAPFVGPFIARISKGRTVRQFLACAIVVPTVASILWFSIFGGNALIGGATAAISDAVSQDYTQGLFLFFDGFPLTQVLSFAAIILLITFVITSADSAVLVCGLLEGENHLLNKLLWGLLLLALSMALVGINDVDLNKQIAIAGALPFTLVLVGQLIMMLKDMVTQVNSR